MRKPNITLFSKDSVLILLAMPNIFFGIVLLGLYGISLINILFVLLIAIVAVGCGYFLSRWHSEQLVQFHHHDNKNNEYLFNELMAYTTELEKLLIMIPPKIIEQVFAARELTELEISVLLRRFSAMLEELQQIIDFANNLSTNQSIPNIDGLKNNAEKIRAEIDVVLEALQFQDRVSQILTQVQDNLDDLKKPAEKVHFQAVERHSSMIQVEELLDGIQKKYDSVNQMSKRLLAEQTTEELTFF